MVEPFLGSEAVASGAVTESALRRRYDRLFPDVYVVRGVEPTAEVMARAGWLWAGRRAVVAGCSAAALWGARWIDPRPVELLHDNRNPVPGIRVRGDRTGADEATVIVGIPTTTPARTALDVGCWYPVNRAVPVIDSLIRASNLEVADAQSLAGRYPGRRGIRRARKALELADGGAQSPKETWLRLLLVSAGLPRPGTQIAVEDEYGNPVFYLDMGWEDIKVAVEYDGEQHRTDRRQYTWDVRRLELLERLGWIVVRVVAGDRPDDIVRRVRAAIARRTSQHWDVRRRA